MFIIQCKMQINLADKLKYLSFYTFQNMNLLFLLLITLLAHTFTAKKYTCVFDQLYKDYNPHTQKSLKKDQALTFHMHGRQLAVLSRTPIRITLDTSDFDTIKPGTSGAASTTLARLQYIKRAMQVAEAFFQNRVQVTQVSRIYSPVTCFDFSTSLNDQQNGIASSDLHIYVQYISDKVISYGATGIHCSEFTGTTAPDSTFQAGRPTIGRIKFNTYTLLENAGISNDQALLTNRRFASITATAIHETMHILGFNSNLYSKYLDPRTSNGAVYTSYKSNAISLHPSRPATIMLTTPSVTAWARDFFGCQEHIHGMQLENQDATTPGSHWERVIMYDQLMTATTLGPQKTISGATFALLKDMGWYNADDRFSDYTNFGYKLGCNFYNDTCYGTSLPKYFCTPTAPSTISQCSSNFLGKAVCSNQPGLLADNCPGMWAQYHSCVDPDQADDGFRQYTLEKYQTDSFCITSTLGIVAVSQQSKSRCYPYECITTTGSQAIKFKVGTYTVTCLKNQSNSITPKTISALSGSLFCPDYDDFCVNSRKICKNWCSKNGICTRGICNCYPGFSGDDCSKTICLATQYYIPSNNTCSATCPSGTYQNKYCKTCLPCQSPCNQCLNQPLICSSCHSTVANPQVFYLGVCYSSCPVDLLVIPKIITFKTGDTCSDCNQATSKCGSCFGTATNCTSCLTGFILDGPISGACGLTCPNPTYPLQDQVNWKCVDACTDNLVADVLGGINVCIKCNSTQFKWISDGDCHDDCAPSFYKDTVDRFCRQCHSSCLYCDGSFAQNCTKCKNDNPNQFLLLKMCVSSCPAGYYANPTSGACQLCTLSLNCATCFIGAGQVILCSTCKYGFYYQQNKTCLTGCDQFKYKNKWNHSCDDCSLNCGDCSSPYDSSCTNCRTEKYFLSNQTGGYCLADCPSTLYVKTGFNCLSCHKTCKTCNGVTSSSCHSCVQGLFLYGGFCRYVCPEKTYPNKNTSQCDTCHTKCKFCFGSTVDNCTSCQTSLVLNNYTCSGSCPKGMLVNQWSVCQKSATYLSVSFYLLCMLITSFLIN